MQDTSNYGCLLRQITKEKNEPIEPQKFFETVKTYLESYGAKVKKYQICAPSGYGVKDDWPHKQVRRLIKGIISALQCYLDGFPNKAYNALHTAVNPRPNIRNQNSKSFTLTLSTRAIELESGPLFRMRAGENLGQFGEVDMFHIPFQSRHLVSSQRYSIPGFPTLYLGNSIYTCWNEIGRPRIENSVVASFLPKRNVKCIDLRIPQPEIESGHNDAETFVKLMTWPLIWICSRRSTERFSSFNIAHVIPQLFFQIVRSVLPRENIRGVIYSSQNSSPNLDICFNYAFPVQSNNESGHCQILKGLFDIDVPLPYSDYQIERSDAYVHWKSETDHIDIRMPNFKHLGRSKPYSLTTFGQIEFLLENRREWPSHASIK